MTVFVDTDIGPGAFAILAWTIDDDAFAIGGPFSRPHVVWSVDRVHKTGETERWTLGEESFAQVLGSLEVLEVLHEELGGADVLFHRLHLAVLVVTDDDDLVKAESGSCFRDLTDKVSLEFE